LASKHLRERPDIIVQRWARAGGLIRRGQLHPRTAVVEQSAQDEERRVIRRHRLKKLADMVDHKRALECLERVFALGQLAPIELQLHMPAEGADAVRHFVQDVPWQRTAGEHEKPDAAYAEL